MVMAIAFQLDTSWAQIFRKWMVERVVNKEKVEREWQKTGISPLQRKVLTH